MPKLATHVVNFLENLHFVRNVSPFTLKSYSVDLFQAYACFGVPRFHWCHETHRFWTDPLDTPIRVWTENDLLKSSLAAQSQWTHLSSASRQRKAATLKSFLKFLFTEGHISRDLSAFLSLPKRQEKLPHFISVDEFMAVLKQLKENRRKHSLTSHEPQLRLVLVLLLYGGGLRVSEAAQLLWKCLDPLSRTLTVEGKGNQQRIVALPTVVIDEMLSLPRKGEYIFGDRPLNPRKAYEWVREAGKQAGLLKNLHPHSLRHSYATHLLSGGMDIRILQELLGHQSLSATQKYLHLGIDKLALTMEQHHPLGLPLNSSRESPDLLNEEVGRNESRTDKA